MRSAPTGHLWICLIAILWFGAGCAALDPPEETAAQRRERLQQTERSYREKIQQDPEDATLQVELADVLLEQSRFDEALTAYGAALDLDPSQALAFLGMGAVLFRRGDTERAVAAYQRSIAIDSENVDAYRQLAEATDHPLHLGVTEAGPPPAGLIKSTAGIATLLAEGIGDTIRYSLTADPVAEARAGRQLLESMGLRERRNVDLIACPSCGRAEIDVVAVAEEAMAAFADREIPLQVAVMGCVVNGPGEARDADLGIAAGRGRGHLFVRGRNAAVVAEDEMVDALVEWAELIHADGPEAALSRVDTEKAEREANRDRERLLTEQGDDVNDTSVRIDSIRRRTS